MTSFDGAECRLCLNRMYNMRNIILNPISPDFELSIPETIAVFFDIKIDKNDKYSKLVCANCLAVMQLINMQRKKFRNSQKNLRAIVKQEEANTVKNDDDPPVLEPFFKSIPKRQGINELVNNCKKNDRVERPCHCLQTDYNTIEETDYIKIPKKFIEDSKHPRIEIKFEERQLANLALYGDTVKPRTRRRCSQIKKNYLRHVYNKGRPGVIRELIQDQVRRTLYISDFDKDNRLKSIYEYDFNLKQNRESEYDEELWKIDMQLNVFVCTLCNKVFYSKYQLDNHQKMHKKYQAKLDVWKVIF